MLPLVHNFPTVESLFSLLWGLADRWRKIAEGLEFDESVIEEIHNNSPTDAARLLGMLKQWASPSRAKLSHVLRNMGEDSLAEKCWSRGMYICISCWQVFSMVLL